MYAFRHNSLSIPADRVWLDGVLAHAPEVRGLVVLVQNGCVLHTDLREAMVGKRLEDARIATLRVDLLTRHEELRDPDARYNVPLMANRLLSVVDWIDHQPEICDLSLAIAASGTTCGAAVRACARRPERFAALLCRGGRPDLAGAGPLRLVRCPTVFVVGDADPGVESYQRPAFELIAAHREWLVVEGADEDFRSPGTLEQAARQTVRWFEQHLGTAQLEGDSAGP